MAHDMAHFGQGGEFENLLSLTRHTFSVWMAMVLKITGSQQHWMPMSRIPGFKRGNSSWSSTFKTSSKDNSKHCYSQGPEGLPHSDRINEKVFIAYLKKYSVSFFILLNKLQLKWPVYHIPLYASVIEDYFWVFIFWAILKDRWNSVIV